MNQDDPMDARTENSVGRQDIAPHSASVVLPQVARPDPVTAGLQQMFAAIADEPIPDDFLRLLDEIEASSKGAIQ